jgi:hypothetical protein
MGVVYTLRDWLARQFGTGHAPACRQMSMLSTPTYTNYVVGFSGSPSGTFTLTWNGGTATGTITYSSTPATLAANVLSALNTAYGSTWTVTGFSDSGGNAGVTISYTGSTITTTLTTIMTGTNPNGAGATIVGIYLLNLSGDPHSWSSQGGIWGGYQINAVVASAIQWYDGTTLPSAQLIHTTPASMPVGTYRFETLLANGLIAVPAGANNFMSWQTSP